MRLWPVVASMAVLPLFASGIAAAAPAPNSMSGEMVQVSSDAALQQDFEAVVRSDPSRTLEGVKQDYETTVAIDGLSQQLKEAFPGIFGFIKIVHGVGGPDAEVHLSAPAPAGLTQLLDARSARLAVVVDQKMSQDQVGKAVSAVSQALQSASGVKKISVGYDYEKNAVNVFFDPDTALQESILTGTGARLATNVISGLGLPQVPINVVIDRTFGGYELFTGGTAAGAANGTYVKQGPVCTYSFAGRDRQGNPGLLGATHCTAHGDPTVLTYEDRFNMSNGVTADVKQADARFYYKAGETIRSAFIYERNQNTGALYTRNLQRVDIPDMNEDVCMFGWRTQKQVCSVVTGYDQTNGPYENLIQVRHHLSTGGDSGGPWFYGPTGFGIHEGAQTPPVPYEQHMLMSPITDAINSTGVRLAFN